MMPAVVLGLLGTHMLFIVIAITLATGDRSFAVVPDYYQKAVDYDDRKALLATSAELGWVVELTPGKTADVMSERDVVVQLRDADGQPVRDAQISVSCYHFARASEPLAFKFDEILPGQYVGRARLSREGFWQFELIAEQGDKLFISQFKQFVTSAEGSR